MRKIKKAFHLIRVTIRKIDIFGVPMKLKLFKKDEYCTCYGSLLTIILIAFLGYKTITLFIEMMTRQEFDFKLLDIPDMDTPLQMTDFTLYLCPANQNNTSIWSFGNFINFNDPSNEMIKPYQCTLFNLESSSSQLFKTCFCYDIGKHQLRDSNNINQLTTSIGSINLNINSNEEAESSSGICLFYSKNYVQTLDYYYPVRSKQQMHFIQNVSGKHITVDFVAENIEIIRENDIQFGEQEKQNVDKNITNLSSVTIQTTKLDSLNGLMTIQFLHSGWMKRYIFNGFDNDKFFSTLGGYYEIWIWVFSLLGQLINSISLKVNIREKLIKKQENTMLIKLNNIREKELIQFDLENIKSEQHPCEGDLCSVNNNKKSTSKNSNSNNQKETNKCNEAPVIPQPNASFKKLESKEGQIVIKREVKQKVFNPVEQFETFLDLGYLYQIVQEVKLLELLCLNQKNSVLFFNCRLCEFDLKKLDRFTKDASLCIEDKYSMNSFDNKIEILQQAMIDDNTLRKETLFNRIKQVFKCKKKETK